MVMWMLRRFKHQFINIKKARLEGFCPKLAFLVGVCMCVGDRLSLHFIKKKNQNPNTSSFLKEHQTGLITAHHVPPVPPCLCFNLRHLNHLTIIFHQHCRVPIYFSCCFHGVCFVGDVRWWCPCFFVFQQSDAVSGSSSHFTLDTRSCFVLYENIEDKIPPNKHYGSKLCTFSCITSKLTVH